MRLTFPLKLLVLVAGASLAAGVAAAAVGYSWTVRAFETTAKHRLRLAAADAAEAVSASAAQVASADEASSRKATRELRALLAQRVERLRAERLDVKEMFALGIRPDAADQLRVLAHFSGDDPTPPPRRKRPVRISVGGNGPTPPADAPPSPGGVAPPPGAPDPPDGGAPPPDSPGKPGRFVADDSGVPVVTLADLSADASFETGLRFERPSGLDDTVAPTLVRTQSSPEYWCIVRGAAPDASGPRTFVGVNVEPAALRSGSEAAFRGVQIGGLVALLVGGGLGFGGTWLLTRPLTQVAAGLRRMSSGDFGTPLEPASEDEVGEMALHANHAMELLREQIELKESLKLAQQVQQALLPDAPPKFPGLDIATVCVYCDQTGGDYVDHLPIGTGPEASLALVVGDVTGHGIPAALLMATARAILRSRPPTADGLGEFMSRVNRELCVQGQTGRFMTLFLLLIEPRLAGLKWVSAGHDGALVYDPVHQTFSELNGSDLPLGVESSWQFTPATSASPLGAEQVIVIGTDGIWELRNRADKLFGKENLKRVIRKNASSTAEQIGHELLAALDAHRGEMPAQDDITFVVVKVARGVGGVVGGGRGGGGGGVQP